MRISHSTYSVFVVLAALALCGTVIPSPLLAQNAGAGAAGAGGTAGAPGAAGAGAGSDGAAAPTTANAPPVKIVAPPGFKVTSMNGRNVVHEAADEPWIATAVNKVPASTKPTTLPASLIEKLGATREALLRQVAIDLVLSDLTSAARQYDIDLVAEIRKLDAYRPPIFYLVTSNTRITELMRGGWSTPHFYYNRAADAVSFNPAGLLTTDRPQDEAMFPVIYDAKEAPEKRAESLGIILGSTEASIQASIDIRARTQVGAVLAAIIEKQGIEPLQLKEDQAWFGLGVASILSAKYASMITGDARGELVKMLTLEHPQNPIQGSAIDLLHPTPIANMRPEVLPAYFDAVRRKSGRVLAFVVERAGDAAVPKSITAVREKKPADGPAMAKVVQDATTVDVAPLLVKGR